MGIEQGQTVQQVKAVRPTFEYDPLYSTPGSTGDMLTEAVYNDLRRGTGRRTVSVP